MLSEALSSYDESAHSRCKTAGNDGTDEHGCATAEDVNKSRNASKRLAHSGTWLTTDSMPQLHSPRRNTCRTRCLGRKVQHVCQQPIERACLVPVIPLSQNTHLSYSRQGSDKRPCHANVACTSRCSLCKQLAQFNSIRHAHRKHVFRIHRQHAPFWHRPASRTHLRATLLGGFARSCHPYTTPTHRCKLLKRQPVSGASEKVLAYGKPMPPAVDAG